MTPNFRALIAAVAVVSSLLALASTAAPTQVLVTLPPGATAPAGYNEMLSAWRQSGQVSNVLLLDQAQKDKPGFRSVVVLEFPSEGSFEVWRKEGAPRLAAPLAWKQADVMTHAEITPRDSNRSIFVVNAYQLAMSPAAFKELVDKTVAPGLYEQRAGKSLIRYTMYLERDANPRAILVREYRDSVAFGRRGEVKGNLKGVSETQAQYLEPPPPSLPNLPSYKPEFKVVGGLRIVGSELKNAVDQLAEEFTKFHPDAKLTTSHIPSSEGGIAGLYFGLSDVAPMGDDAKITDVMPFYNTFGYMPTEISVATGGYEKRGSLFAWAIVVNKDNPLNEISLDELTRVFGSERSGGWELVGGIDYKFTSKFARGADSNIRKWGQLGLTGEYADKEIQTFGYSAPGFATYFERNWFNWSKKWNPNFMEYVEVKQTSPGPAGLAVASERPLEALANNKYAMGIAGLMHAKNYPHLKVLAISPRKGAPAVALTPENVLQRKYPLIRDAFFYLNKPPGGKLDPKAREFMRFVLSREGQEVMARVGYYYPLDAAYLQEQLKKLD
jgi:phosphate transport system substrate-binding protein